MGERSEPVRASAQHGRGTSMTDTSTWGGLPDVKIDESAANLLAAGCTDAARLMREQVSGRRTLTTDAMKDFEGQFSRIFQQNQQTANSDGENIATALEDVARQIRYLVSIVPAENARRRAAREWKARYDKDKSEITFDDIFGDEAPPEGPTSPPAPKVLSATAAERETPQPGSGGGGSGGGTSSARPDELRSFATGVSAKIQQLDGKPARLQGLNADFTSGFDWGTGEPSGVDGAGVYAALRLYNQLNAQDKTWVTTVAEAFDRAGAQAAGGMRCSPTRRSPPPSRPPGSASRASTSRPPRPGCSGSSPPPATPTTRSTPPPATSWRTSTDLAFAGAARRWR